MIMQIQIEKCGRASRSLTLTTADSNIGFSLLTFMDRLVMVRHGDAK